MPPIIAIPACVTLTNERLTHATPARYAEAIAGGADAVPIMIPPMGSTQLAILDSIHGLLCPGSRSNVHPSRYGRDESLTPDRHDLDRDATTLPLIRAAVARGLPVLAICRGIQELNVALGGTLHQNIHEKPGRFDHRPTGATTLEVAYGPRHGISLTGTVARIVGAAEIVVNSLHSQAIDRPGDGLVVEALAEDGTIEAVSAPNAPGFVLGLQWHPEWGFAENPASVAIFRAFGDACRAYQRGMKHAA